MSVADPPRADASGRGAAFSGATGGELKVVEPLIFERSATRERDAVRFPQPSDVARERAAGSRAAGVGAALGRPRLPEVSELELLRHFNRLARLNQAIDLNFYPLGSCTMKYNPKVNEWAARRRGFAQSHPLDPEALARVHLS